MTMLQFLFFIAVLFCSNFRGEGKSKIKIYFPAANDNQFPRLRLQATLPSLREFTFCSWVRPHFIRQGPSFILSYATSRTQNEIEIMLYKAKDKLVVGFHMGKSFIDFKCSHTKWEIGVWHHICLSWYNPNGRSHAVVNGKACPIAHKEKIELAVGENFQSGGVLMIGMGQVSVDSVGNSEVGWRGDITDFHMWDELLDESQMIEAGKCGGRRKEGNMIAFMKSAFAVFDGVTFSSTNLCEA